MVQHRYKEATLPYGQDKAARKSSLILLYKRRKLQKVPLF
jgi:hypothetical protein